MVIAFRWKVHRLWVDPDLFVVSECVSEYLSSLRKGRWVALELSHAFQSGFCLCPWETCAVQVALRDLMLQWRGETPGFLWFHSPSSSFLCVQWKALPLFWEWTSTGPCCTSLHCPSLQDSVRTLVLPFTAGWEDTVQQEELLWIRTHLLTCSKRRRAIWRWWISSGLQTQNVQERGISLTCSNN